MTRTVSDSRLALYEGLISLAWADERLVPSERIVLEDIFTRHVGLSSEQRQTLIRDISRPRPLNEIWSRLTNPQDRGRFLDMADVVFKSDGEVSSQESDLYAVKLAKHLGTLDVDGIQQDLNELQSTLTEQDEKEAAAYRDYAKNYGLFGFLKRLIDSFTGDHDQRSA